MAIGSKFLHNRKIPSIHKACGTIVCYINHMPHKGEYVKAVDVTLLDGSVPKSGDRVVCPKCGVIPYGIMSLTVHPDYIEEYNQSHKP